VCGLPAAPVRETAPLVPLAVGGGLGEVALARTMEKRAGVVEEAYQQGRAKKLLRTAEALTAGGALLALAARRNRVCAAVSGAALLAGSALTRFGVFEAGVNSAEDPRYTVVPQRERLSARQETTSDG